MGLDYQLLGKLPDPVASLQNAIQFKYGLDQAKLNQRLGELKLQQAQQEMEDKASFRRDMQGFLSNPTAAGYAQLIGAHPDMQKQAGEMWKAIDGSKRTTDLTAIGEIATLMKNGDYTEAGNRLERRIAADQAAGQDVTDDKFMLDAIRSGDPAKQKKALGLAVYAMGAADPEHAKSFLESMGLSQERKVREVDGILYDDNTGEAIAQSPYPQVIPGPDGFYVNTPGGGGIAGIPTIGGGKTTAAPAPSELPATGADVWNRMVGPDGKGGVEAGTNADGSFRTSPKGAIGPAQVMPGTAPEAAQLAGLPWDERRYRNDFNYNLALGKAYFAKQLQDFGEPALAAAAYNAGPTRVRNAVIAGGRDWLSHLPKETRDYVRTVTGGGTQIAQARSKQEYDRLPSGTRYIAPDGTIRIKG